MRILVAVGILSLSTAAQAQEAKPGSDIMKKLDILVGEWKSEKHGTNSETGKEWTITDSYRIRKLGEFYIREGDDYIVIHGYDRGTDSIFRLAFGKDGSRNEGTITVSGETMSTDGTYIGPAAGGNRFRQRCTQQLSAPTTSFECEMLQGEKWVPLVKGIDTKVVVDPSDRSLTDDLRKQHNVFADDIIASAERMPAEHYDFRPDPEVRSFGEIIAHLAHDMYGSCSGASVLSNPHPAKIELTEKAALVKVLKEAFRFCDEAYASIDDAKALERIDRGWREGTRLSFFVADIQHSSLHYGNIITYMRMKGVVPGSTVRRGW